MADIASFVLEFVKCLAAPIGRQFMYLYNYKKNIDNLQDEVRKLKNTKEEVQHKVNRAVNNLEDIKQDVKDWQTAVTEAEQLIPEEGNNPRCFKGLCPNWITRYKLSRDAVGLKRDKIDPLLQQGKEFKEVARPTNPPEIWLRSNNKDYLAFESRTSTEKNVWDALNDKNIFMIGVYGMGGLGKTTLVKEVGRKAAEEKLFDEVVFIEVTETPNMETIQLKIAEKLGLELNKKSDVAAKANKLYARLKLSKKDEKGKKDEKDEMDEKDITPMKILLILDNIWKDLNLATVGIPSEDDRGGCKLLLTTRDHDVLDMMRSTNRIRSTKNCKMDTLNKEEAWSLFQKMAGDVIKQRELNSLPQDVCKECGGLPIVICTIAKALSSKSHSFDWKDALDELRTPSPTKFRGILENEYKKLALSYKYLRDDELRKTFLICSLMENDASISDLFKHVMNLEVLEINNPTMERARNRLDKVVRNLKNSCLLLDGSRSKQFSMHDSVRVVAITIAYIDHHVFTARNDIENEWKNKDKLKKCKKISLRGSSIISQLWPEDLDCPNLEFFYMINSSLSSFEIPKDFFKVMPKLKVLNLCNMQQLSLPPSVYFLTNLQTLCLDYSGIEDVAIIGKLRKLKVLSLRGSNIKELPTEMGQLTQLRLLDLSNCWHLEVIMPNVISKLSQLEELYMKGCGIQWKVEVLKELNHLSQLTSLEIVINDNKMLPKDFFSKKLERCKISLGDWSSSRYGIMVDKWLDSDEFSRMLKFKYDFTISLEELQIVKNVEILRLAEFSDDDNNLTPLFNEKVIFSHLKVLELKVTGSRRIWDSQPPTFVSSLTCLTLKGCGNIKYVFPFCIAKSLQTLQHLEISDCEVLEEIVAEEEGAKAVVNFAFQQVTFLKLSNLPKLTVFYNGINTWEMPMLIRLAVEDCEKFTSKYLNFHENSLHISEPKSLWLDKKINHDLEIFELRNDDIFISWHGQSKVLKIEGDQSADIRLGLLQRFENLNELQVLCGQYKELFFVNLQNLEVLNVRFCTKLMKLITPSTARSLVQLREMSIQYCEMLIEIVANEGDATTNTEIVFDNLKKLSLTRLNSLTCFCSENYFFNFPSLEELIIDECPNVKTFSQGILSTPKLYKVKYGSKENDLESGGSELNTIIQKEYKEKVDSNLEKLTLSGRDIMRIWEGEFQERFGKVKTMQLIKDEYTNIPIQILHKFNSLETLILKVSSYEEIFSFGEDNEHTGPFTKLKLLKLQGLFNLKCIWKEDSRLNSILQNLYSLEVEHCDNLMTLLPSSASFENLTTLSVGYCNGMKNLMSSSIVKSLVQLQILIISGCKLMIEVLANEVDIEKGEIVFGKLKALHFYDLESLTCFYSGDYTLKFPFLESLNVIRCSKMKTFSGGDLSMPRLQQLNYNDCSKSDIDTIIQQLQNDCSDFCKRFKK